MSVDRVSAGLAWFDGRIMDRKNAHGVGFVRGTEGEDSWNEDERTAHFLSALEALALLTTCSDEFCAVWEEYEAGYAEGVRVKNLLDNRGKGVAY